MDWYAFVIMKNTIQEKYLYIQLPIMKYGCITCN